MSQWSRSVLAVALSVPLLAAGAGCGGGSDDTTTTTPPKPPRSAEIAPPRLKSRDKDAYAAIQTASGTLRAAVVPAAYGATTRIEASRLRAAARKVRAVRPRNPSLKKLQATTESALTAAAARGGDARAKATAATAEADRIDDGLRRYAASHPAANEIAPG